MGYCTDLYGKFDLNKNLTDPEVIYLTAFNETRHFKRDVTKMGFPKDYFGKEGEFYVSLPSYRLEYLKKCILDKNDPLYKYYTAPEGMEKGILYLNDEDWHKNFHNTQEEHEKYGIIDYNKPAGSCPSLYCTWTPSAEGNAIEPDGMDKPYDYIPWIVFIINNFLKPKGYELTGVVEWQGEEPEDFGKIKIKQNEVHIFKGVKQYKEVAIDEYININRNYDIAFNQLML